MSTELHHARTNLNIPSELTLRPYRTPDFAAEHRALATLVGELAENPRNMLQRLAEVALDLCRADSAGVCLLDDNGCSWEAKAGVSAAACSSMPSDASLSGLCVDRNAVQLLHPHDRAFPDLRHEPQFAEALLVPFHDHGQPVGTVWVVRQDGSRQFDAEDARLVGELTHFASAGWQLWRASEAAARSQQRKDQFIATLGHELRNPLSVLKTASQVMKIDGASRDALTRGADIIGRQVHHITRLVNDLLDVSRIESGKLQLDVRAVDVREVVSNTLESRRADADRRQQSLTMDLAPEPIVVDADAVRLVQVVSNLVDNAIKYTPDAGHITVAVTANERHARIVVQDDGAGIPSDQIERIFEPFTQLPQSRGAARGGMGLGLALVRRLTELHGGTVDVASGGPGLGSRFAVSLPLERRPAAPLSV